MLMIETTVNNSLRVLFLRTVIFVSTLHYLDPATKHELIERNTSDFPELSR